MAEKLGAEAFLYLSPEQGVDDFAQCSTCRDWVTGEDRCYIHGRHVEVRGSMSCGFYVYGEPLPEGSSVFAMVSPVESGLVDREVRCENCRHLVDNTTCGFFDMLNKRLPDTFEIDTDVDPKGCCNAQQPRETEAD